MKHCKEEPGKIKKGLKIMLIVVMILVILATIILLTVKFFINNKTSKIKYDNTNYGLNELGISEQERNSNLNNYRNIAILGVDSRYNDYEDFARTDCIMIASINKTNNNINLFSIYRDTLTEMDLHDKTRLDKINHAYYGGVETTLKTINTNFDLNVSEYIMIDFEAVADLVNQVGGVEISITSDELKYINGYIKGNNEANNTSSANVTKTGLQNLNGTQALAYARIRYTSGGDYKRTERMRTVLEKTFQKLKDKNLMELNKIVDKILPEVKTNISEKDIQSLLPQAMNFNFGKTFGFPYNVTSMSLDLKDYYEGTTKGVDSYVVPLKLVEDVEKMHKEVFEENDYVVSENIKRIEEKIKNTANLK